MILYSLDDELNLHIVKCDGKKHVDGTGHIYFDVVESENDDTRIIYFDWIGVAWFKSKEELIKKLEETIKFIKNN